MLEEIPEVEGKWTLHRFAVQPQFAQILNEDRLDQEDSEEMAALIVKRLLATVEGYLCSAPFDVEYPPPSRYSDGTIPVFYGSLESKTAESEVKHRLLIRISVDERDLETAYYVRFRCLFSGTVKDLRAMERDWPDLVHDTDYKFCNSLGTAAKEAGLDGLLVPSARRIGGTNMPVFSRIALDTPFEMEVIKFTYNPETDDLEAIPVPSFIRPQ